MTQEILKKNNFIHIFHSYIQSSENCLVQAVLNLLIVPLP